MRRRRRRAVAMLLGLAGVSALGSGASGAGAAAVAASAAAAPVGVVAGATSSGVRAAESSSMVRTGARWLWPITPPSLSRAFEAPPMPYAAGHRGIDLRTAPGSRVAAPSGATVRFAGLVVDRRVLTLDHGGGVLSSYEPLLSGLSAGDAVAAGDELGQVSAGGHCAATCLHIGVRVNGEYVSPLLFFDRVPRAVLLPLGRAG